jgi:hypothetical protein
MFAPSMTICRAVARTAASASVAVLACGQPHHPPTEEDEFLGGTSSGAPTAGGTSEGGIVAQGDAAAPVPTCALGPEGGVCDCVDQPLLGTPPTLYFVLDRSGSMNDDNKWLAVREALFGVVVSLGPRARFGAAVFPDPSSQDVCAAGIEVFAPMQGDSPAGTEGPVEAAFFSRFSSIPAAGGTPTSATLEALYARLTSLPGVVYVILATDGGPNCNAAAQCDAGQCTVNIEAAYADCPVGGPPNCCSATSGGSALDCLDSDPTTQSVLSIADAGIPVYVMGMPGSAPYASLLDRLAQAGGTARPSEPLYYAVGSADQGALQQALSAIAASVTGTCTLNLNNPPNPALVNVFFDEQPLNQAGPDGWTLDGGVVTILGASCQQILAGSILDVRVVVGCPTYIR